MKPHIDNHNPDPTYIRALLDKAGLSQHKTAHIFLLTVHSVGGNNRH